MNVAEFHEELTRLYPRSLSCDWDNDGIMCSHDISAEIRRVLVSLDATADTLEFAANHSFDTVLVHHPFVFNPMKGIVSGRFPDDKVIFALAHGITVISLHTRFDAGEGGVNDVLAEKLGLCDVTVFGDDECPSAGRIGCAKGSCLCEDYAKTVKEKLGCTAVTYCGDRQVSRVAVVGGAGKDFIDAAISLGADTFVTGEASYNSAIDAAQSGINIIEAGHYYTENPSCVRLAQLAREITGAQAEIFDCLMQSVI